MVSRRGRDGDSFPFSFSLLPCDRRIKVVSYFKLLLCSNSVKLPVGTVVDDL